MVLTEFSPDATIAAAAGVIASAATALTSSSLSSSPFMQAGKTLGSNSGSISFKRKSKNISFLNKYVVLYISDVAVPVEQLLSILFLANFHV